MFHVHELWRPYKSDCPRCGTRGVARRPWLDFWHDLYCWSLKTATYNLWFRVKQAFN